MLDNRLLIAQDGKPPYLVAAIGGGSTGTVEPLGKRDWIRLCSGAAQVEIRGRAAWKKTLRSAFESLAPTELGKGCVVDILSRYEFFIYRDSMGVLLCVPAMRKPVEVPVVRGYRFRDLIDAIPPHNAPTVYVTDVRAYPFVFADAKRVVFLTRAPKPAKRRRGTLRLLSSTLAGQFRSIFSQPVSSFARLFATAASTATDVAKPDSLILAGGKKNAGGVQRKGMDLKQWERALDASTGTRSSRGRLRFHIDGVEFFPRLIDVSLAAQRSLDLRMYIFDNDDYAVRFADFLRARSARIRVRVMVDNLGTQGACMFHPESLPADHRPPRSIMEYLRRDSKVETRALTNPWLAGDHTKAIIIDERVAFVGGMNIGREYRYEWHDMMAEVRGPIVARISTDFERAWTAAKWFGDFRRKSAPVPTPAASEADYPIRILYTRPGDAQIRRAQIDAIRAAKSYIYIHTPYLTSDAVILELARARKRGVDVRVILPGRGDSRIVDRNHAHATNAMLKRGIRVYVYPGMSHLKAAIYDGWACFGSANFDHLSLRVNREMNLATSHAPAVRLLMERVFVPDFQRAADLKGPVPAGLAHFIAEWIADGL